MEATGMMKDEQMYGFSVSLGNILESSNSLLQQERSPNGPVGEATPRLSLRNQVDRKKNPGASNKTSRKSNSKTRTVKTTNLTDDGLGWRKYGQKTIQNNPHPRSYYRCTHIEENCEAKKWVQKESDNPPVYNTTYLGHHTCRNPLKVPQIFLPYTPFDEYEPYGHQYYQQPSMSMLNPTHLLCFDSPNTNHTSYFTTNDQYITGQMGFAPVPLSSSPQVVDPMVFHEPINIGELEGIQQISNESEIYENGVGMITDDLDNYCDYFPPMESPSYNFGSTYGFDMMTMDELIGFDIDSVINME